MQATLLTFRDLFCFLGPLRGVGDFVLSVNDFAHLLG